MVRIIFVVLHHRICYCYSRLGNLCSRCQSSPLFNDQRLSNQSNKRSCSRLDDESDDQVDSLTFHTENLSIDHLKSNTTDSLNSSKKRFFILDYSL